MKTVLNGSVPVSPFHSSRPNSPVYSEQSNSTKLTREPSIENENENEHEDSEEEDNEDEAEEDNDDEHEDNKSLVIKLQSKQILESEELNGEL